MTNRLAFLLTALLASSASPAFSQRPAGATGTVVVPDHYLRRWDPVTIFFDRDLGPAKAGAEDAPERFVSFTPEHPGAFTWLDARTLQFRPAEPWPPLAQFTWRVERKSVSLVTLMSAPASTLPAGDTEGLDQVDTITLTFPEPLDAVALARMTSVSLRPLPGVGAGRERLLTRDDFDVKPVERRSRSESASYVLALHQPIPLGTHATVHLRLSLDDKAAGSFARIHFATAEPRSGHARSRSRARSRGLPRQQLVGDPGKLAPVDSPEPGRSRTPARRPLSPLHGKARVPPRRGSSHQGVFAPS